MNDHDRVKQCREHFHLSQTEMAARVGLSLRAYQNYERGEREIPVALVRALYEILRVDPIWLLTGAGFMLKDSRKLLILEQVAEAVDFFEEMLNETLRAYDAAVAEGLFTVRQEDKEQFDGLRANGLSVGDAINTILRRHQRRQATKISSKVVQRTENKWRAIK